MFGLLKRSSRLARHSAAPREAAPDATAATAPASGALGLDELPAELPSAIVGDAAASPAEDAAAADMMRDLDAEMAASPVADPDAPAPQQETPAPTPAAPAPAAPPVAVTSYPIAACLDQLGLDARGAALEQLVFESLAAVPTPFVLLLSSGNGVIVRGIEGNIIYHGPADGPTAIDAEALAPLYGGAVLLPLATLDELRARSGSPATSPAPEAQAETAKPAARAKPEKARKSARAAAIAATAATDGALDVRRWILKQITQSRHFMPLLVVSAVSNIFVFAMPTYSMIVYDRIIPHRALETLWAMTIGITLVLMVDLFVRNIRTRLQEAVSVSASQRIQEALVQRLMRATMGTADRAPSVTAQAIGGIEGAALAMPALVVGLAVDLPFVILTLAYVAWAAKLAVLVPIVITLGIVGVTVIGHFRAKAAYKAAAQVGIKKTAILEESLTSLDTVKTTGMVDRTVNVWGQLNDEAGYQAHLSRMSSAWTNQWVSALSQFATVGLLCAGVLIIGQNGMTVGTLVATVLLSGRILSPVAMLAATITRYLSLDSALEQAQRLLQQPVETTGDASRQSRTLLGHIQFVRASVSYGEALAPALNEVSFTVTAGQHVGIIGRVGSGKSTIAKLITRLAEPKSGSVLIDHYDARQYSPEDLRSAVAYMSQDCDLFDTTLRENIVRGLDGIDEDLFERVVRATGVYDLAARHPEGFGMRVGPAGRNLSGGERQAVCLARTLCRPSSIVVLDEPTAAMDSQFERLVIDRIKPLLAGKTAVVITHRAPALALVERVVWLDGGNKIADGTTRDVLAQAGRASA